LEDRKRFQAELREKKRENATRKDLQRAKTPACDENDLSNASTTQVLKSFAKAILKRYFASKLTIAPDKSAVMFVELIAGNLVEALRRANLQDAETQKLRRVWNVRPANYFAKSPFYERLIKDYIAEIVRGAKKISSEYRAAEIDQICEYELK